MAWEDIFSPRPVSADSPRALSRFARFLTTEVDLAGQLLNVRASVRSLASDLDLHQQPRSQPGLAVESDNGREGLPEQP